MKLMAQVVAGNVRPGLPVSLQIYSDKLILVHVERALPTGQVFKDAPEGWDEASGTLTMLWTEPRAGADAPPACRAVLLLDRAEGRWRVVVKETTGVPGFSEGLVIPFGLPG